MGICPLFRAGAAPTSYPLHPLTVRVGPTAARILLSLQDMNTQSAILLPEPGSVIDGATTPAVWFKGYAWCGKQPVRAVQ
jgi:hypothetical protein